MNAHLVLLAATALLAACSSTPLPPDWQLQARPALEGAVSAQLQGDTPVAQREFERARGLLSRTGQPGLLARGELMRCAARVASLDFAPCDGFERLRADAPAADQAYADHLAGRVLAPSAIELLPPAQRAAASAIARKSPAPSLQSVDDPLSRLIAAALLFRAGQADPATIALAADTASAQGWRRPLLAWLEVQARLAERAGASDEARRLRRRIAIVTETG